MSAKPNLFAFATSELSQDAFFAWLLAWADPRWADTDASLHRLALALIELFVPGLKPVRSVEVRRQLKCIDVLAVVDGRHIIVIEDKSGTCEHHDQLNRYRLTIEKMVADRDSRLDLQVASNECTISGIYLQSGDQSNFSIVHEGNFRPFKRKDILGWLGAHAPFENAIIADFYDRMRAVEKAGRNYELTPRERWEEPMWRCFFQDVQDSGCLPRSQWKKENNPGGSFVGLFSYAPAQAGPARFYLHLQEGIACFKMEGALENHRRPLAEKYRSLMSQDGGPFQPSHRRFSSRTLTVGKAGEYRVFTAGGLIDFSATLGEITAQYERVVQSAETLAAEYEAL